MTVARRAWLAWQRFFFAPTSVLPLALVRIALGLVLLMQAYSWWPDLATWFGDGGLSPFPDGGSGPTVFSISTSPSFVTGAFVLLVVAACFVTVGLFTRVASVLSYVLFLSFEHRMPYIFTSGDLLFRLLLGLLCLAPAGAGLSLDRWLRHRDACWEIPKRSVWPLRLMQIQLSVVYLVTVWLKLRTASWQNGLAMYYGFQQPDLARVPMPGAFLHDPLAMRAVAWGLLGTELVVAVLVWSRRVRPYVLLLGVLAHVLGHVFLVLGLFTYVVLASYLAFVDPQWCSGLVDRLRRRRARARPHGTTA